MVLNQRKIIAIIVFSIVAVKVDLNSILKAVKTLSTIPSPYEEVIWKRFLRHHTYF